MNKTSELNPTRVATIAIVAVALLGVIAVGTSGESDSQGVPAEAVEESPAEPPPVVEAAQPAAQTSEDFDSWASESDTEENASDDGESASSNDGAGDGEGADQAPPETVAE